MRQGRPRTIKRKKSIRRRRYGSYRRNPKQIAAARARARRRR